ncbi:hypothetical protein EG240_01490 [Paenimyroides tangerinum]|uniref:Uncharacterized protein n=1 Tax=Paenimyroides tangerinum TaxID=2488728 RepID=A0A3P3WDD7_9FLAO|nr:DUF6029 family protein [Paenimyroides tangerinum]RRJ93171.1 hypothetical protein EG240_01490 [Paenimyroides tangerinum]
MFKKIVLASSLILTSISYGQLRVGVESNSQYYVDDEKIKLNEKENDERFRSNNYIKIDYTIKNFEFGLQGEAYYPKALLNFNPELRNFNIGTLYARYNNYEKGIDVTAGHIYEQFGSGLALRFWEDRALGINNALFGAKIKYRFGESITAKVLAGKQRIGMGLDLSDGSIFGADLEVDLSNFLKAETYDFKFGATYVGRNENISELYPNVPNLTNVFGPRVEYIGEKFNVSFEYLYKSKDVHVEENIQPDILRDGSAYYANMGYNSGLFAANLNLRRLENFTFFSQRDLQGNLYNTGMINYVPSLTKQYDHSLQNIFVYQSQPQMIYYLTGREKQGEIGGQFDVYFELEPSTFFGGETGASIAINGSYWAGLKNYISKKNIKGEFGEDIELVDLKTDFFGFGTKYYKDFGVEYRKKISDKFSTIFSYLNQFYNSALLVEKPYLVNANTLTGEGTYFLSGTKSVRLELQHQWADSERGNWAGGTAEYVPNSTWSFFIHDIYNYGTNEPSEKLHYYSFGGAFTKGATRIAASYGRQRGGMMCVGGVCRYVPEAAGFTLNLTTNF